MEEKVVRGTLLLSCIQNTNLSSIIKNANKRIKFGNGDEEAKTEKIKKGITQEEPKLDEGPVNGAVVCCTSAETQDKVYILDNKGNAVTLNNLSKLSRTDITMSGEFTRCRFNNKICPKNKKIEGNEWQDYDEFNGMGKGKEGLNKDSSYMVCLTGYGVIYFVDSGQKIKGFSAELATLNQYVNEEAFSGMGWNLSIFYNTYGNDAIEVLKNQMYKYGITDTISICMFLATLGAESGDGEKLLEGLPLAPDATYTERTRGAGLIQITGKDQKAFLEYIQSTLSNADPMYTQIQNVLNGYPLQWPKVTIYKGTPNEKTIEICDNNKNVTEFIAQYYPIESAAWYWGEYGKTTYYTDPLNATGGKTMTLNEYVTQISEKQANFNATSINVREDYMGKLFVVTQYYVNGSPWALERLQRMAESTNDSEYEIKNNQMTFTVPAGEPKAGFHSGRLPNGWEKRKADWESMGFMIFG